MSQGVEQQYGVAKVKWVCISLKKMVIEWPVLSKVCHQLSISTTGSSNEPANSIFI